MLDSYIMFTVYGLYILGGISLLISVLAYIFLPRALDMLIEEDSEDDTDS